MCNGLKARQYTTWKRRRSVGAPLLHWERRPVSICAKGAFRWKEKRLRRSLVATGQRAIAIGDLWDLREERSGEGRQNGVRVALHATELVGEEEACGSRLCIKAKSGIFQCDFHQIHAESNESRAFVVVLVQITTTGGGRRWRVEFQWQHVR